MRKIIIIILAIVLLQSCKDTIAPEPVPEPQILSTYASYSLENEIFFLSAKISDEQGNETIVSVNVSIYSTLSSGRELIGTAEMNDKGLNGDIITNDEVYSATISINLPDSVIGYYKFIIKAKDEDSNTGELADSLLIGNLPPVISDLIMPDSIQIHPTDTLIFDMSVVVADTNGLDDISSVVYEISSDSSNYGTTAGWILLDNGVFPDSIKGDGTYTGSATIKPLDPDGKTGKFFFRFSAIDKEFQRSNYLFKTFYIYE